MNTFLTSSTILTLVISCGQITGEKLTEDVPATNKKDERPFAEGQKQEKIETGEKSKNKTNKKEKPRLTEPRSIGGVKALETADGVYRLEGTAENSGLSKHSYTIETLVEKGRSLTFDFFSSRSGEGGYKVSLTRKSPTGIEVKMSLNGISHTVDAEGYGPSDILGLVLDLHNDHTDIHVLLWKKDGPFEDHEECSFDGGCLYNSADYAFDIWLGVGQGTGKFWGVRGDVDQIIKLRGPEEARSDV